MKPDRLTMVVCAVCMASITVALYIRTTLYPAIPSRSGFEVRETNRDPYNGGRIIVHYHERHPYYISRGKGVGGIIGDRINFVFFNRRGFLWTGRKPRPSGNWISLKRIAAANRRRDGSRRPNGRCLPNSVGRSTPHQGFFGSSEQNHHEPGVQCRRSPTRGRRHHRHDPGPLYGSGHPRLRYG